MFEHLDIYYISAVFGIIGFILLLFEKVRALIKYIFVSLFNIFVLRNRNDKASHKTVKFVPFPQGGIHSNYWWSMGECRGSKTMQVVGRWYVTNIGDVPITFLQTYIKCPRTDGTLFTIMNNKAIARYQIDPDETVVVDGLYWILPPVCVEKNSLKASIVFVDQFGNKHEIKNVVFQHK